MNSKLFGAAATTTLPFTAQRPVRPARKQQQRLAGSGQLYNGNVTCRAISPHVQYTCNVCCTWSARARHTRYTCSSSYYTCCGTLA